MNKYIDADRLLAEIERLYYNESEKDESILAADAYKNALDAIEKVIDSLRQEQPDFPTTDEEIEMLLATHPKVEVPNKYKTPDWLWKKQEQLELNLEKEVEKYLLDNADFVTKSTSKEIVNTLARHFYELGRNQVLQELYKGKIKPVDKITAAWLDDELKDKEDK